MNKALKNYFMVLKKKDEKKYFDTINRLIENHKYFFPKNFSRKTSCIKAHVCHLHSKQMLLLSLSLMQFCFHQRDEGKNYEIDFSAALASSKNIQLFMIDVIRDFLNIPSTGRQQQQITTPPKVWCDVREYVKFYLQRPNWNFYGSHVLTQIFLLLAYETFSRNILSIPIIIEAKIKFEVFGDE